MSKLHPLLLLILLICSCQNNTTPTTDTTTNTDTDNNTTTTAAPVENYPENYQRPSNDNTEFEAHDTIVQALQAWNQAINDQDMEALERLYHDDITYYTKSISKTKFLAKKEASFEKHPDYQQHLGYISILYPDGKRPIAECQFKKVYTQNDKKDSTQAIIQFDISTRPFTIIKESDNISDLRVAKNLSASTTPFPKGKHYFSYDYWLDTKDDATYADFRQGEINLSIEYTNDSLGIDFRRNSAYLSGSPMQYFVKDPQITSDAIRFKATVFDILKYDEIMSRIWDEGEAVDEVVPDSDCDEYYFKIIDFKTIIQIDEEYQEAIIFKRYRYEQPGYERPE